jgi:cytosine/adenosine deaminase-related metal-dependent hydrolase
MTRFAFVLFLLLLGCAETKGREHGAGTIFVANITLLDGRGGPEVRDAWVRIEGDRIASVGRGRPPRIPRARLLDGGGGWLVPGFVDMHAHLLTPLCGPGSDDAPLFDRTVSERALSMMLDFGVTTVRSPATPTVEGLKLRDDLNAGRVRGPRAFAAAELINGGRADPETIRATIRAALPHRPDFFKAYSALPPASVAALIDEAHRHGVPVIGHLQRTSWREGIALGIDQLTHAVDWSAGMLPPDARHAYSEAQQSRRGFASRIDWLEHFDPDGPVVDALISELARRRIPIDPTLVAYDSKFSPRDVPRYRSNPYVAAIPERLADGRACSADPTGGWSTEDYRRWQAAWPKLLALVRRYHEAGMLLTVGTDYTNPWIIAGESLHQEMELLAEAGIPNMAVLSMATANAAEALGVTDIGIVAPGRRADLVLLAANPVAEIANTRQIVWVMQGGRIVSRGPRRHLPDARSPL